MVHAREVWSHSEYNIVQSYSVDSTVDLLDDLHCSPVILLHIGKQIRLTVIILLGLHKCNLKRLRCSLQLPSLQCYLFEV